VATDSCDLLRRSRAGDRAALEDLLSRHYSAVRAFVRLRMSQLLRAHESADDLVQSACRELFSHADTFDYRGEEAFRAWLFTTVLHKLRNHERNLRAQRRDVRRNQPITSAGALSQIYSRTLGPDAQCSVDERIRALEAAIDSLPEHYREVITLSRIARLGRGAVAALMRRSEDSVRNLLPRALVALAAALERALHDDTDQKGQSGT
jgi:RNA polymerase sigma-70 factor (ECF subfamily)